MTTTRVVAGEMMRCPCCREPMGVVAPARMALICVGSEPQGGADYIVRCPGTLLTRKLDSRPQRNPCRAMIAVGFRAMATVLTIAVERKA